MDQDQVPMPSLPSFLNRGGVWLPSLSAPRILPDSEALIESLAVAEAARLTLQQRITELEYGVAIEHALRGSTFAFTRNASTTPLSSYFSSPLLHGEPTPPYSECALMKDVITKTTPQQQMQRSVPPHRLFSMNLPRSTLQFPSTPTGSLEDTLDMVRERNRLLATNVPTKGGITRPALRPRHRKYLGLTFPTKLFAMLLKAEAEGFDDVISFLPHGKAFMVYQPEKFAKEVMPRYFNTNRLPSFQKQLSLYGFKRTNGGQDHGAMFHKFFRRDDQKLVAKICRRKAIVPCGDGASRTSVTGEAE